MVGIGRLRGVIDSRWRIDPPARSVLIGASVLALCIVPIRSDTLTASWASPVAAPLASDPIAAGPGPRPEETVNLASFNVYANTLSLIHI